MTGPTALSAGFPPLPPREHNGRTLPVYLDRNNEFGEKRFLTLRAAEGKQLPKNPWILSDTIKRAIGKVEQGRQIDDRNFLIETRSEKNFHELQKITSLINGDTVTITPHPTLNSVKFVFTCNTISTMDLQEIKEHLAADKITDIYRFAKKTNGQTIPTNSYVVTMQATQIPEYIFIGMERIKTRVYYPRPMRCNKCLKFGHTTKNCKSVEICATCGKLSHGPCDASPNCTNCNGNHNSFDKKCPQFTKEAEIIKIKVDNNYSFRDARIAFEQMTHSQTINSFAQQRIAAAQNIDPKDKIIENLTQTVNMLKEQINSLTNTIDKLTKKQNKTEQNYIVSDSDMDETSTVNTDDTTTNKPGIFKHPLSSSSEDVTVKKIKKGNRK